MSSDIFSMIRNLFSTSSIFVLRTVVVTKLLVSDILFSTLIFVFKTAVVTIPQMPGIFLSKSHFSLNFVYQCGTGLYELKGLHQELSYLNYSLLSFVCWILCFSQLDYLLHPLFFSKVYRMSDKKTCHT